MKRKILFILDAMGGGVYKYILDLANELVNSYDIYVAYVIRKQAPADYIDYFDKRINLVEMKNLSRSINPTKDIKVFFEIKKIAKQVKPDIIHPLSSKAGALRRFAFKGKTVPLFYTPHGYSFLMKNHSAVKRIIYWGVETVWGKRNCMTISSSESEHQESLKLTKNVMYVNNGINVTELQNLMDSFDATADHPFTVFTLGRICYQKKNSLLNKVAEAMPDVKFLWIGDGELRNELTAPNIEITGWGERKVALKHLLQGDVFFLTSLWEVLLSTYLLSVLLDADPAVIANREAVAA